MTSPASLRDRLALAWDGLIIALVIVNLALLLFDSLYLLPPLHAAFAAVAPRLEAAYADTIHAHFFTIDLAFVSVYVLDVLIGWTVAIAERRYHRWFFYPFVHWYDVLGCIPLAGFRWLRALRVFALLHRLQRMDLIDVRRWTLFQAVRKYYDILLEEVSDRVAVRLLGSLQEEVRHSNTLSQRLADEVVAPRKAQLVEEIAERLETGIDGLYADNRALIARYVSALVGRTLQESPEIQRLHRMPMGRQVAGAMDQALSDLASRLIHEAVGGLRSPEFSQLLRRAADSGMDILLVTDRRSERITEQVLIEVLELLKEQIATKRWQTRYD
ncbi:ion transporter [Modicisalibacter tunisiensis]|uniref:Ion transporter n=1 Tax=Modicisalibacter tunisiensis TaxID=390637 RepID=A0ABS7WZS7_9GAMM|nr:ion transporter [Modicisalibacter tunisiensis]MBZ9539341.1 ion transporter [Modicisalibacter tunisiensis]MBZ9567262.1 ion transporter [Modicisalibacter tunisiensis]